MLTVARDTLPFALFSPAGYELRTGLLAAPARVLQGGAPLLSGVLGDLSFLALALVRAQTQPGAAKPALT